ncbi:probable glutamate receptor [Fopius arisanus]|uniref:Probable glutamate receptor n=1 Tax=Fopius arisanus TaxID=64838 RepID=A0A9R1TPF1_9HYME|nr:PREDICTED: probable glutamate receptor [Fopius arisanus]
MWALLEPFSLSLWFAVVVITILMSIALWKQAWIDPRVPKRFKSYINAITELMGRLVGSWAPRKIKGLRVQLQLWHFAGLLLVTAYSSSLAAILTTPDYEPRIDTAKNFIESNLTWGSYGAPRNLKFFFDMNDTYAKQIPRKLRYEANEQERGRNILSKNYAIYGRIGHKIFFPVAPVNGRDLNNYRLMREPTSKFFLSFITQPWLVNSIDTMVSRLIESGFAEYHIRDIIRRRFTTDFRSVFIEHDVENKDKPQPLELKPLGVAFIVLFIGYFVATAVFLFEVRARKNEKAVAKGKVNIQRRINQRVRKLQLKYFIRRCIFQR